MLPLPDHFGCWPSCCQVRRNQERVSPRSGQLKQSHRGPRTNRLLPLRQRTDEDDDKGDVAVLHRLELGKVDRLGMGDELVERAVDAERSEARRVRVDDCGAEARLKTSV